MNDEIKLTLEDGTETPLRDVPVFVPVHGNACLSTPDRRSRANELAAQQLAVYNERNKAREQAEAARQREQHEQTMPGTEWRFFCGSYQKVGTARSRFGLTNVLYQTDELAVLFDTDGHVVRAGSKQGMSEALLKNAGFGLQLWCPDRPWTEEELAMLNEASNNSLSKRLHAHVLECSRLPNA